MATDSNSAWWHAGYLGWASLVPWSKFAFLDSGNFGEPRWTHMGLKVTWKELFPTESLQVEKSWGKHGCTHTLALLSPFVLYRSAPSDGPPKSCRSVAPCSVNLRTALCCRMWWPIAQQLVPVLGEVNGSVHLQKLGLEHFHQTVSESFETLSSKLILMQHDADIYI